MPKHITVAVTLCVAMSLAHEPGSCGFPSAMWNGLSEDEKTEMLRGYGLGMSSVLTLEADFPDWFETLEGIYMTVTMNPDGVRERVNAFYADEQNGEVAQWCAIAVAACEVYGEDRGIRYEGLSAEPCKHADKNPTDQWALMIEHIESMGVFSSK